MKLTRAEFEKMVRAALRSLPKEIRAKMRNVAIVIEEGTGRGRTLGLYRGVPLKDRTHEYSLVPPDKITLYKRNIETWCREEGLDIRREIRHTIEHEVAHHFGISDERLDDEGVY